MKKEKEMKALREKHLACVADNLSYFNDCKTSFAISECKSWINKIFDDVEAELEALQSSSCDTCEYDGTFRYMGKDSKCTRCCNFFSSRYVRKGERDD